MFLIKPQKNSRHGPDEDDVNFFLYMRRVVCSISLQLCWSRGAIRKGEVNCVIVIECWWGTPAFETSEGTGWARGSRGPSPEVSSASWNTVLFQLLVIICILPLEWNLWKVLRKQKCASYFCRTRKIINAIFYVISFNLTFSLPIVIFCSSFKIGLF